MITNKKSNEIKVSLSKLLKQKGKSKYKEKVSVLETKKRENQKKKQNVRDGKRRLVFRDPFLCKSWRVPLSGYSFLFRLHSPARCCSQFRETFMAFYFIVFKFRTSTPPKKNGFSTYSRSPVYLSWIYFSDVHQIAVF